MTALEELQEVLGRLKLDDSLLALNHFLAVTRGFTTDPPLEAEINKRRIRLPPYIVHFLAKQLLLHGSNLGHRTLDWTTCNRLVDLCIALDDPIQFDPNWKHGDPTGFFERVLAQQIPAQSMRPIQCYGLGLGLFRDVGTVCCPDPYDLRADVERELGVPIESFMAMGHVCLAFRQASLHGNTCMGTFRRMYLVEAYRQGISVCIPEVWERFLSRVACDRDTFRQMAGRDEYKVSDPHFLQFEFNPLRRFPVIEVINDHFLAVDPQLIVERTTFGLFYDLFERHGTTFSERFGHAFDRFVGQLLASACPPKSLWSATEWESTRKSNEPHSKIGDWAYRGHGHTILFECKSLRPSLELTTYGSDDSVRKTTARIVSALSQLIGHAQAIQDGKWESEGLNPGPVVCVVVTYGRIHTVNNPFVRKRILERLAEKSLEPPPFVVLSMEELDGIVRLVELGHALDDVVLAFANQENSFNTTRLYDERLAECAVSSFALSKGKAFMDGIVAMPESSPLSS